MCGGRGLCSAAASNLTMIKRYILTGTPGAGKTAILRQLELDGFGVVEESATDVIALEQARGVAEPWMDVGFVDAIVRLQRLREIRAAVTQDSIQFHDRSVVCTAALAEYLGFAMTPALAEELERIGVEEVFQRKVFFIRGLGFIEPTQARRISLEEALRFERIHEETYARFGFENVFMERGSLQERVDAIRKAVGMPIA
jgi:predicted ATPase